MMRAALRLHALLLLIAICCCPAVHAQTGGLGGGSDDSYGMPGPGMSAQSGASPLELLASDTDAFPTDNVVDPEVYKVGPGDVLLLQLVGTLSGEYPLMVSPESMLMLPRIGRIAVLDKNLAEVRDTVEALYRERNANWGVAVSLLKARTVFVDIGGNVKYPRMYALPASMRVSTAVQYANQDPKTTIGGAGRPVIRTLRDRAYAKVEAELGENYLCEWMRRNTVVYHKDGTSHISDDIRARLLNRPEEDPTLREGDEIFVPFEPAEAPTVSIAGAVRRPAIIPWRRGDSLSLLLRAGYGLADHADSNEVYYLAPGTASRENIDVAAIMSGQGDRPIAAGAKIVVERSALERSSVVTASVSGMVTKPGTFVIQPGETRLKDLVEMAGGTNDEAYLPLAYVLRRDFMGAEHYTPEETQVRLTQFYTLGLGDTARFRMHNMLRSSMAACDVGAALLENSEQDNIKMQNGDVLVIPPNPMNVYVYGHVVNPGYVGFVEGRTATWYLQQAGGAAESADMGRAAVIKGRTNIWIEDNFDDIVVESGDIIYIPADPQFAPGVEAQEYSFYVNLVSAAVVVATTLINWLNR